MADVGLSILRRIAAMVYETLLLSAILLVCLVFPHVLMGAFAHRTATPAVLWLHLVLVLLVYFVGFWSHSGQTLAMKTWRIRLVSCTGEAVHPSQAMRRFVLCWPSIALGGIGLIWALFDRDGQFLHDRLAGTRLISAVK